MLVDSHCHLDFPDFSTELEEVVARARMAGVGTMLTICTKVRSFPKILALAERYTDVWCSVGLHPHEAAQEPEVTVDRLVDLCSHEKVVGIGETGLDYFYEHSPRERQRESFQAHIEAARRTDLPLIVHTRDAEDETVAMLDEEMGKGRYRGLIHCFSGTRDLAAKTIDLGLYISISGIITFRKADALRQAVSNIPLDRILVETDAPYLAPEPKRGKRNEPAFVRHTADRLAAILGIPQQKLDEQTTNNFFRLFSKARRPS